AGHEAIGAAAGLAVDLEQDFLAPHYRDLSACLAWGLQPREVMAHYFGRAVDPCTGGRQPYAHWGSTERRMLSASLLPTAASDRTPWSGLASATAAPRKAKSTRR